MSTMLTIVLAIVAIAWSAYLGYTEFWVDANGKLLDRNNDDRRSTIEGALAAGITILIARFYGGALFDFAEASIPADTHPAYTLVVLVGLVGMIGLATFGILRSIDWLAGTIHIGLIGRAEIRARHKRWEEIKRGLEYEKRKEQAQQNKIWSSLLKMTELN